MSILVCNAGSSTLKFGLFEDDSEQLLAGGDIDWGSGTACLRLNIARRPPVVRELPGGDWAACIAGMVETIRSNHPSGSDNIRAVGHRVVHGGERFVRSVRITSDVKQAISQLSELAPLHNPPSLAVIEAAERLFPGAPQIAAFDTAFFANLPEASLTYPLPHYWRREWGIRRFGFHGLSHAYCMRRAAEMVGRPDLRIITAHLGNGASVSAVCNGVCLDTSMGFTPLEGLMMGTRSGSIDPGILLYLQKQKGMSADQLDQALNHESGLRGVSGISGDMREVLSSEISDARLAVEIYVRRLCQTVGSMAAVLNGVDCLVFTAGVGEGSAGIRSRACTHLTHLGLELEPAANETCRPDCDIARRESPARILVIHTREDLTILRDVHTILRQPGCS